MMQYLLECIPTSCLYDTGVEVSLMPSSWLTESMLLHLVKEVGSLLDGENVLTGRVEFILTRMGKRQDNSTLVNSG